MLASSGLDQALPDYDVVERHNRLVHAAPQQTMAAFRGLTLQEVPAVGLLFAARSLPARVGGSGRGLPSVADEPLLGQFLEAGFTVLVERPGEIVIGVVAQMWRPRGRVVRPAGMVDFTRFAEPGFAKAALNFTVTDEGGGTCAVTETRVQATDPGARRSFARYWRVVRPFSGLVRRILLHAVASRAEIAAPPCLQPEARRRAGTAGGRLRQHWAP